MYYTSTRNNSVKLTASQAIIKGISDEGGLTVPNDFPTVTIQDISRMVNFSYKETAKFILKKFLDDFSEDDIDECVESAYKSEKFSSPDIAPVVNIDEFRNILELWHGPTCAFKDMALQLLPHLMKVAAKKSANGKKIIILVATSGDTGKAALEGFKDVENTQIFVFYPEKGVSDIQKLQMQTQEGNNVSVAAVRGNFDDAQSAVKVIFTDQEIKNKLKLHNMLFSSANSINWGRLVPQIVYYFSSYCSLVSKGIIQVGEKVNFTVPTGNFGNILAAFFAETMGLPVNKLICASNSNNILTDFLTTGVYDINREFYTTTSPSMDILISSNLERLLYCLSDRDEILVNKLMKDLSATGIYTINDNLLNKIQRCFCAGWASEKNVADTIKKYFEKYGYLMDTHTAAAVYVYDEYRNKTNDDTPTIIDSTASPYKFAGDVASAILGSENVKNRDPKEVLNEISKMPVPSPISNLGKKNIRFKNTCEKDNIMDFLETQLGI